MQTISDHSAVILLALGANLPSKAGPPSATLRAALAELAAKDVRVRAVSRFFITPAWPDPHDPEFVNAVARIETELTPGTLLEALHDIEAQFGRRRSQRNAPRTLDLDILDFDGRIEEGPPQLPHPRLHERGFVLLPLADVASDWRHPVLGHSVAELIARLGAGRDGIRVAD